MRPLEGVRVLDLSRLIPGPFATLVLSDLGAQVDKVEDSGAGDYLRYGQPQVAGTAAAFHALNRGKRSAILNLKKAEGRAAFERMLASYDVLFEQFRPGVLDRLGFGHEALRRKFPRLVVCALTGYGQNGPLAGRAGHDLNYLARAGVLATQGPGDGPPQVPGFQLADVSGGMWCVIAILAALRKRDIDGEGSLCDIAMTDGVLGFASLQVAAALAGESFARGAEMLTGGVAPYQTYLASDGAVVTLGSLEPKFWLTFAAQTGIDPDPVALLPGPHQAALRERMAEVFRSRSGAEWKAFAEAHDCCVEVALTPAEIATDPQLAARGLFFDEERDGERVVAFRTPVSPARPATACAPRPGEHSRVILSDAGFSEAEIDALVACGAVSESP